MFTQRVVKIKAFPVPNLIESKFHFSWTMASLSFIRVYQTAYVTRKVITMQMNSARFKDFSERDIDSLCLYERSVRIIVYYIHNNILQITTYCTKRPKQENIREKEG